MSTTYYDVAPSLARKGCPDHVIAEAIESGRQVVRIIWDEPEIPDHCNGYEQWSVRPYRVTDRCDGTRDDNALLVCLEFCRQTGLDLDAIHRQAYPDEDGFPKERQALLERVRRETEIPALSEAAMLHLLNSLYAMNQRSLVSVLSDAWEAQGYAVKNFWKLDQSRLPEREGISA